MTSATIVEPSKTLPAPPSPTSVETSVLATPRSLSIGRVVASLQVVLAARRVARNDDYAYWYNISRGL